MSIWRFAAALPPVPEASRVTLGEGDTPLIRSRRIGPAIGLPHLYFKLETANPTGSYKDRFAAAAVSQMRAAGQQRCLATSSGNTGAALAAYCAAADLPCRIALVETAPAGKLVQMLFYGAQLVRVRGFGPDPHATAHTFAALEALGRQADAALQISAFRYSPSGMAGVQTISYELAEQFDGRRLDHVFAPVGGGGLALAVARGFERLEQFGQIRRSPCIQCVQPAGNDTVASPLRAGATACRSVDCTTRISGLQVPAVIDGDRLLAACRRTSGTGWVVSDESTWRAQFRLAREEGIFCEPAGAVALAGVLAACDEGCLPREACVVCLITGSGFKDFQAAEQHVGGESVPVVEWKELESLF